MPYQNEFAQYNSVRRMSENLRVKELLRQYRLSGPETLHEADSGLYRLVNNGHGKLAGDGGDCIESSISNNELPELVLAIDGSFVEVPVSNGVLSAGIGYVTITDVLLDLGELTRLDRDRPVDPQKMRMITSAGAVDTVLAGCNIIFDGELDPQSSFRRGVVGLLSEKQALVGCETLLDSYEALLAYKPLIPQQRCPYGATCEHKTPQSAYRRISGTKACECPLKLAVHSTDALRIYEKFNPLGENTGTFSETMQVVERLWLIHTLRSLEQLGHLGVLSKMAIVMDGPLAVFGSPGWLSRAISKELFRINALVRQQTGDDLLLVGIEKTGMFVDHLARLCSLSDLETATRPQATVESGSSSKGKSDTPSTAIPMRPQTALLPTDGYIRNNVVFTKNTHQYGDVTYFGRKIFYRTISGAQIVATLPFLKPEDRNLDSVDTDLFPRLADALSLFDALGSSRYTNALIPVSLAHGEAAIPTGLGKRVLEVLAREFVGRK